MKEQTKRIFNYARLLDDVKKRSQKSQVQISEDLGCTIIHTSNVKNQKSNYSLEKIIKLINSGDYCIDDYVELEGSIRISSKGFDNKRFEGVDQKTVKALLQFVQSHMNISQKKEAKRKKKEHLSEDLVRIAGAKIRQARKEKGIRPEKIAAELRMREGSYRNMENGSTGTTLDNYAKIARVLGISLSEMFEEVLENQKPILHRKLTQMFEGLSATDAKKYNNMIDELLLVIRKYSD